MQDNDISKKKLFDKKYYDYYTREEKIEAFRQSVALHKCIRHNTGKHYIVINDGTKTKRVDPDLPIPQGWVRGFIPKGKRNEQQSEES